MKKPNILLLITILFSLIACKKDEHSADILTSKSWKPALRDKNLGITPGIGGATTSYAAVRDCDKDDTYTFSKDGKLSINYGTNKCNNDEPGTVVLNYSYNRASKELIIDGQKFTVGSETTEQLKYYAPLPDVTGYQYIVYLFE